jgi:hypothetical protein
MIDENITSIYLLNKMLELNDLTNSTDEWSFDVQKENTIGYIQLKEIQILSKLFLPELNTLTLKACIESILHGKFIHVRNLELYERMYNEMNQYFIEKNERQSLSKKLNAKYLESNYLHVLIFKKYLHQWKSISPVFNSSNYNLDFSNQLIDKALRDFNQLPMDSFLAEMIDPKKQSFKKMELVNSYGYPDSPNIINYI